MPEISFCTLLRNRGRNFRNFYETIRASTFLHGITTEIVVADYGSDDLDLDDFTVVRVPMTTKLNVSEGNNAAADAATGNILYFIEPDLVVPLDCCPYLRENVFPGQVVQPVFRCLRPKETAEEGEQDKTRKWRRAAEGLLGITREDWAKHGPWPVLPDWCGQDTIMARNLRKATDIVVVRDNRIGLWHQWHPRGYVKGAPY